MSNAQLLNPNTPLAWVTPELARKLSYQNYAVVWALAVLSWDIVSHIPDDYKLVTRYRINHSVFVYFLSRLTSLVYLIALLIGTTTPVKNCNFVRYVDFLYPLTLPVTLLLFVFRVCALYNNDKYVVAFFSLTWLSVLGSSIAFALGVHGKEIARTGYCLETVTQPIGIVATVLPAAHDTFVFWATSWAFMWHSASTSESRVTEGFKNMVLAKHLPAFSKSLLRDGQAYYLATLIPTFAVVAMSVIPDPLITPCTVSIPLFALTNNLACYVYRNMRFGFYKDEAISTSVVNRVLEGVMTPTNEKARAVKANSYVFESTLNFSDGISSAIEA